MAARDCGGSESERNVRNFTEKSVSRGHARGGFSLLPVGMKGINGRMTARRWGTKPGRFQRRKEAERRHEFGNPHKKSFSCVTWTQVLALALKQTEANHG